MTLLLTERAPVAALRSAVFGFLAGGLLGGLFVTAIFAFDIGRIASMAGSGGTVTFGDLGLLPATFGLIGLIVAPALASAAGRRSD